MMPRIKPLTMAEQKTRTLKSELDRAMGYEGKNHNQMIESTGISHTTWYRRYNHPETFTMDELWKVKRILPSFQFSI